MGTVAEKLTYLNGTKSSLKTAINNLGGDITNETTFRNYATELDSIYSNLPKVSDTGTNVSLSPTLKGRLGIVPKGNTYQETTTGKNLLDTTITTQTLNGVQITRNSDGSITLNGTTTATFNIEWKTNNITLPAGTYYIGLTTTTNSFNLYFNKSGGGFEVLGNPASSSYYTLTLNEETTYTGLKSYVGSGITFNNVTFYPMITKTLPFTYEKYTNGASPNPDYPQEIQSATGTQKVVVSGKNLLPFTNQDYTYKNVRYYVQNGNLYLDGTSTGETYANAFKDIFSFYLEAGTYSFKQYSNNPTSKYCRKYSDNTNLAVLNSNNRETTFTLNERTQVYLGFYVYNQSFDNELLEIQLEQGSTATPYQPYQEPQEVDIELGNIELNKIGDYEDYIDGTPDNWVLYKQVAEISSYNGETITTTYMSTTGGLDTGAKVLYGITETTETITDTNLVSQLNELYYLQSYNDTINIDVTGNLPMRITASAIKGA